MRMCDIYKDDLYLSGILFVVYTSDKLLTHSILPVCLFEREKIKMKIPIHAHDFGQIARWKVYFLLAFHFKIYIPFGIFFTWISHTTWSSQVTLDSRLFSGAQWSLHLVGQTMGDFLHGFPPHGHTFHLGPIHVCCRHGGEDQSIYPCV